VRLCPTRARIVNVPFHSSRRFGEVVLHDGVPNGERVFNGTAFPVFDEIELLAPSDAPTLSVMATGSGPDLEKLTMLFTDGDFGAELASSRKNLCACCSEGTVTQERTFAGGEQRVLIGGASEDTARELLRRWQADQPAERFWTRLHAL
jgi:hypothetical protein